MAYDRRGREQLGRTENQLQAILSRCKREGNRGLNSSERTQWEALTGQLDAIQAQIEKHEAGSPNGIYNSPRINETNLEEIQDLHRLTPGQRREREADPWNRAFSNYIRRGMEGLDEEERQIMRGKWVANSPGGIQNTMSTTTGTQGGFTVPTGFSGMLEEAMKWFGGISGIVGEFRTDTGNPWPWPTINDTMNRGRIIGQNVQVTETDLTFNQVTFNAYIGSSDLVLIPLALMEDSFFDLDALLAKLLGTRLGRLLNWKCTIGTGVGEPTGIVTAAVAAGNINTFPTGETAAIGYNDLVNTEHSVDPAYRFNSSSYWMFSDSLLKLLKKLVDGNNRPLWQPGLTASFREGAAVDLAMSRPTILDHPYIINQDIATPAANSYSLLFGDMSTFKVRKVANGVTVLRLVERYADYLQIGVIGFFRFDSQLVDAGTRPLTVGQQSAS